VRIGTLSPRRLAFSVAAVVIALDQLTKAWVVATLSDGPVVLIDGFLQLRLVRNPGAAFSLLQGAGSLIALGAVAAAILIVLMVHRMETRFEAAALGLVLGGAIGNLIDRIFRGSGLLDGEVVDFVDFDFFPTFNVADSAITIGAALAILVAFRKR
jgi:signal peptidase II